MRFLRTLLMFAAVFAGWRLDATESVRDVPAIPAAEEAASPAVSLPKDFSLSEQLEKKPDQTISKTVPRKSLDDALKNLDEFTASVRVVPFFRDQKVIGYRFLSIKPGSLMETMGYEKGDILLAYAGKPLDPDNPMPMMTNAKSGNSDSLIYRDGKFVLLQLKVQN